MPSALICILFADKFSLHYMRVLFELTLKPTLALHLPSPCISLSQVYRNCNPSMLCWNLSEGSWSWSRRRPSRWGHSLCLNFWLERLSCLISLSLSMAGWPRTLLSHYLIVQHFPPQETQAYMWRCVTIARAQPQSVLTFYLVWDKVSVVSYCEITDLCHWAQLYMGSKDLDSGCHTCVAIAWHLDSSPQPISSFQSFTSQVTCEYLWLLWLSVFLCHLPDLLSKVCVSFFLFVYHGAGLNSQEFDFFQILKCNSPSIKWAPVH